MSKLSVQALSLTLFLFTLSAITAEESKQAQHLFNGKDLSNWTWVTDKGDTKLDDVSARGARKRTSAHWRAFWITWSRDRQAEH